MCTGTLQSWQPWKRRFFGDSRLQSQCSSSGYSTVHVTAWILRNVQLVYRRFAPCLKSTTPRRGVASWGDAVEPFLRLEASRHRETTLRGEASSSSATARRSSDNVSRRLGATAGHPPLCRRLFAVVTHTIASSAVVVMATATEQTAPAALISHSVQTQRFSQSKHCAVGQRERDGLLEVIFLFSERRKRVESRSSP